MNNQDPEKPNIEMLAEPLTLPDGILNPACMTELQSKIEGIPAAHTRFRNDPEWDESKNRWTFAKDIVGAFAMWSCRQSPYGVPDGLESVCRHLRDRLNELVKFDTRGMSELSLCEINRLLHEILMEKGVLEFDAWNERKNKRQGMGICSAYDGPRNPDDDFIDLHALLHNVCLAIRTERRESTLFYEKFEKEHGKLSVPQS